MKMTYYNSDWPDDGEWKTKRLVMLKQAEGLGMMDQLNDSESSENQEEQKSLGQQKIEEYLGLSPKEAQDVIAEKSDVTQGKMKELIDNWLQAGVRGNTFELPLRMVTAGYFPEANKRRLDRALESMAKQQAQIEAKQFFPNEIAEYGKDSTHILTYKVDACNRTLESARQEKGRLEAIQSRFEEAGKSNYWLRAKEFLGQPLSNNLTGRIKRIDSFMTTVTQIQEETEDRMDIRSKKNQLIEQWDNDIMAFADSALDKADATTGDSQMSEETPRAKFKNLLREAIIAPNSQSDRAFKKFVSKLPFDTATERNMVLATYNKFKKGNLRGRAFNSEGFIGKRILAVSPQDSRNYFRRKAVEIGKVNTKSLGEKMRFLQEQALPDQIIKIGDQRLELRSKDENGMMFKQLGVPGQRMTYLRYSVGDQEPEAVVQMSPAAKDSKPIFMKVKLKQNAEAGNTNEISFKLGETVKVTNTPKSEQVTEKITKRKLGVQKLINMLRTEKAA